MSMPQPATPRTPVHPVRELLAAPANGFLPQAAGNKVYSGGAAYGNLGPVVNPQGYADRDAGMAARRQAFINHARGI